MCVYLIKSFSVEKVFINSSLLSTIVSANMFWVELKELIIRIEKCWVIRYYDETPKLTILPVKQI